MNFTFRHLLGMATLMPVLSVNAQDSFQQAADRAMQHLDKNYVTSGILYDRVFPTAALNSFSSQESSNFGHWTQAQSELHQAAFDKESSPPSQLMERLITQSIASSGGVIPIGIIAAAFQTLNPDAVEEDSNGQYRIKAGRSMAQVFVKKEVEIAAILSTSINKGQHRFQVSRWSMFSNQNSGIASVQIQFDDGNPSRLLTPNSAPVTVNYTSSGEKNIAYVLFFEDGTQRTAKSSILVVDDRTQHGAVRTGLSSYPRTDPLSTIDSSRITATIPFQGYDEPYPSHGSGDYLTYYAQGRSKLSKPIIIIDGFDPLDKRKADHIYRTNLQYKNGAGVTSWLGDELRSNTPGNGYDVIILNFPSYSYGQSTPVRVCQSAGRNKICQDIQIQATRNGGADFIERNALVLVSLIQKINQQLAQNGSSEKVTIIGPSMGGLISRYALRHMELNGQNANCKLWVSFDSPHHGANISIGLQEFLKFLGYNMGNEGSKNALEQQLDSPAAKQMLMHHHSGTANERLSGAPGFRERFANAMAQLGFPQASCLRKVALNNGSKNGTRQNFNPCSEAVKIRMNFTPAGNISCAFLLGPLCVAAKDRIFEASVYSSPGNSDRCLIMKKSFTNFDIGKAERYAYGIGQPSMDILPGGYQSYFQDIVDKARDEKWVYSTSGTNHFEKPTFIPSFSAWALKNTNINWASSLQNINVQRDTPFDAIYAPDINEEHTILTHEGVLFVREQLLLADETCTIPVAPLPNGCYTIKAQHSGQYLQADHDNQSARLTQALLNGQNNQIFRLEKNEQSPSYWIRSVTNDKIWTASSQETNNGRYLSLQDQEHRANQKWYIYTNLHSSSYRIRSLDALDLMTGVEEKSLNQGASLLLEKTSRIYDHQRFVFTEIACPGSNTVITQRGTGTGLAGQYFNNANLEGTPAFTRIDPSIQFNWGTGKPGESVSENNFSVRWQGEIEAPATGTFVFKTNNDDGTRLWIDNKLLIDDWTGHAPEWKEGRIELTKGNKYIIKKEFMEYGGEAQAYLYWQFPGKSLEIVPQDRLYTQTTNPVAPPVGSTHGLLGEYYGNDNLQGAVQMARIDKNIDFAWDNGTPGGNLGHDNFSVRWTGQIEAPISGTYQFKTFNDDGTRLWINGQQLIDDWSGHPPMWLQGSLYLQAGQKYSIKKEFVEFYGEAQAKLFWEYPGQSLQIIPAQYFYPPGTQIPPTPTPPQPPQPKPCDFTDRDPVGNWNNMIVQTRRFIIHGQTKWVLVTSEVGSTRDRHFPRGDNFAEDGGIRWNKTALEKSCFGAGSTGWWGLSFPEGIATPQGYIRGSTADGAIYFESSSSSRIMTSNDDNASSGQRPPQSLQVYPNPNSRAFTISFQLTKGKPSQLIVSDALGKVWFQKTIEGEGLHKEKVMLGGSPQGMYLVKVGSEGVMEVKKVIVTH